MRCAEGRRADRLPCRLGPAAGKAAGPARPFGGEKNANQDPRVPSRSTTFSVFGPRRRRRPRDAGPGSPSPVPDEAVRGDPGELRDQTAWYGSRLAEADPYELGSKRCSACGTLIGTLSRMGVAVAGPLDIGSRRPPVAGRSVFQAKTLQACRSLRNRARSLKAGVMPRGGLSRAKAATAGPTVRDAERSGPKTRRTPPPARFRPPAALCVGCRVKAVCDQAPRSQPRSGARPVQETGTAHPLLLQLFCY